MAVEARLVAVELRSDVRFVEVWWTFVHQGFVEDGVNINIITLSRRHILILTSSL